MSSLDLKNPPRRLPLHSLRSYPASVAGFRLMEFSLVNFDTFAFYPHRHDFQEVVYIADGRGEHVVDFRTCPIEAPCLFFISPGQAHFWRAPEVPRGVGMVFEAAFLPHSPESPGTLSRFSFFHSLDGSTSLHLNPEQNTLVLGLVEAIRGEYAQRDSGFEIVVRAQLLTLLVRAQRWLDVATPPMSPGTDAPLVRRFKELVSRRFLTERNVAFYAQELNVTSGHLSEVVKMTTGSSPGRLIRDQVILEIKRLLAHTDLGMAEIGYSLGFEDPSYFGRFFRRETAMSPGQFRDHIREKYQISRITSLDRSTLAD